MNPDNTVEYNSLSWIKAQLDDVLSDAQSDLNEYIENETGENLENCIEHLQLVYGTLQMVEVYGAAMLAEEMQKTTAALLAGNIDRAEDAYDVLMRAMLQLPDYLESIQAGKKDTPIILMPLINDLRAARKEGLLTESVLFSPDIENVRLGSDDYDAQAIEPGKLQGEVKRLRTHYQLGLLDFIRNNKEVVGLQRIKAVLKALEKSSSNVQVRQIWMVIAALVEGLIQKGINTNLSIKMLLGAVDRQLKLILDEGEDVFADKYSKELVKNVLYYVGGSTVDTKPITAIKEAYHLSELIPQESDSAGGLVGGLNADLFDTVSKGISEDLEQVKDVLELFMHSSEQDVKQLVPVVEQLGKIADTYGMLSMGATRQSIMEQRAILEKVISGEVEVSEDLVLGVASGLLNAESELENYIASRSGFVDMNRDSDEKQAVPAAEYRQVVRTVVSEGLKNFSEAKEIILSYVSGAGEKEQLENMLKIIEEVRGVAMMLPLGRVETQIIKLQNYIQIALINNNHKVDAKEQDTVADVVTSIEYYLEALSQGRPGIEQGLRAGDEAADILVEVTNGFANSTVASEAEESESAGSDIEISESVVAEEEIEHEVPIAAPVIETKLVPESRVEAPDVGQYAILADDADEEIVEIFIEEAVEVLGELHTYCPQWKANNNDEEALAIVRRSFHTLKGSGRLLGAELIGEFSWKFENMLNRIIDKKINISDNLFLALDEALAVLPQLIEQLKGNREPIDNIAQLMSFTDAVADGREVNYHADNSEGDEVKKIENENIDTSVELESVTVADDDKSLEIEIGQLDTLETDELSFKEAGLVTDDLGLDLDDVESSEGLAVAEYDGLDEEIEIEIEAADVLDDVDSDEEIISLESDASLDDECDIALPLNELADDDNVINIVNIEEAEQLQVEEVLDLSVDDSNEYEIVIDEDDSDGDFSTPEGMLDIDPMLLKIYYDESRGHVESVKQLLDESESNNQAVLADKRLIRAFHTLYGSARTAEVEAIANLSGPAEKYVKARQEIKGATVADDVFPVIREIELSITDMLAQVLDGKLPANNKALQEKINKIVQREMQEQLQSSWQGNSSIDADDSVIDTDAEISFDVVDLSSESNEVEVGTERDAEDVKEEIAADSVQVSYGDIDDELIDIFLEEAEELIESCEQTLDEIKATPNSTEHIHQLQRNMHTLKGGARMADLRPIGDLTHNLESLVVMVDDNKVDVDKRLFDLLHESLDELTSLLGKVKKRQPLPAAIELNNSIEMLMRGEVAEKRAVERFDVDLSELESDDEDIDLSDVLPENLLEKEVLPVSDILPVNDVVQEKANEKSSSKVADEPHWGQRANDVNFKESQEQVRVRADLLNNLVNYAGEVNIYHARMGKQVSDLSYNLSELTQTVVRLKDQLRNLEIETEIQIRSGYEKESDNFDDSFDPLEMDQYSTMQQLTRSLSETAGDVESINDILSDIMRDSETLLIQESRVSTDLQEGLMRTRMVRFGGLTSRLKRIARQVANELGKEVELEISGENSEVDRTVLDRIIAPLEHMLRNAVAHGIESPEERKALRKNEIGKIKIDVVRQGTSIVIRVKDDGGGIEVDKIRKKAIKQGYIESDSDISDHDILQFILQSGFSTADEVTQVSGRGVGMDVVDSEIKQLGGVLDIDTSRGEGTEFNIRLPLTLAINQALLVSTADDIFAIPLASIEGVVRITGLELQRFYESDNSHYEFNGVKYELKHLGGLLTGKQGNYAKQLQLFPVLLVKVGDQHFALHVEDLIGRREIVVKPVGMQIGAVRGIAGATILADGRVVLILEMSALVVAESLFKPHTPIEEVVETVVDNKKTIMVVDDSITIRKVTERMLNRHGINVVLAKDGVDATTLLQDNIPDLMLLDIEMPRMDGFEVASYVRNDERLKNIPIIMITSRTGSKHKEKAMEIGVNRYLGKPFQEEELVHNINEILQTFY